MKNISDVLDRLLRLSFAALLAFAVASCSDDDGGGQPGGSGNGDSVEVTGEDVSVPDSVMNKMLAQELLADLCEVDTVNDSTFTYSHRYGQRDEADPSVMYMKADNDSTALSFFECLVPLGEQDKVMTVGNTTTYTIPGQGSITYEYEGNGDVSARIHIDFPQIPDIKELVFIPAGVWPYNAVTPFRVGQMWQNGSRKYVCIKEYCGDNDKGILMTFDGGWSDDWFDGYNVHKDCASEWAWKKMEDFYNNNRTKFDNAVSAGIIPHTLAGGYCFMVGSHTSSYKFLWQLHRFPYVRISKGNFVFATCTVKKPWQGLTNGNLQPSCSMEFGSSKPAGSWELLDY